MRRRFAESHERPISLMWKLSVPPLFDLICVDARIWHFSKSLKKYWARHIPCIFIIHDASRGGILSFRLIMNECKKAPCFFSSHSMANALSFQSVFHQGRRAQEIVFLPLKIRYKKSVTRIHHRRNDKSHKFSFSGGTLPVICYKTDDFYWA